MKPKLIIIFLLIVFVPLGMLTWLGVRVARYEREKTQREFLLRRLSYFDNTVARFMRKREGELLQLTNMASITVDGLRQINRENSFVRQSFSLKGDGQVFYPSPEQPLSDDEEKFLERVEDILVNKELKHVAMVTSNVAAQSILPFQQSIEQNQAGTRQVEGQEQAYMQQRAQQREVGQEAKPPVQLSQKVRQQPERVAQQTPAAAEKGYGWYTWYWGRGVQILFWRRHESEWVVGAELDSVRLLADVIGQLPETDLSEEYARYERIALCDESGQIVYQWGGYGAAKTGKPLVEKNLTYPLHAWGLKYFVSPEYFSAMTGKGVYFNLMTGLVSVGLVLIGLAIYFYRENSRQMREAQQRVTFVNQVSHELKTPLTNIRMYAELLNAGELNGDKKNSKRLGVIVSESQRLSRLIGNILTFGREKRKKLKLHMTVNVVDNIIECVLDNFKVSLENHGVKVEFEGKAKQRVYVDRDALEQILGNLFSNVEKYAASGGLLRVESEQQGEETVILVKDRGAGIPSSHKEKVFEAFSRVSNKLTDGVSGTGIGLAIARTLARLHGGDVVLAASDEGAVFEVRIYTSLCTEGGEL